MLFDIRTLVAANAAIAAFMAMVLWFYRIHHKTCAGFGLWLVSTFTVAAVYFSIAMRDVSHEFLGIIVTNVLTILASILRLDGFERFINDRKLDRRLYLLPVLVIPLLAYFYYIDQSIIVRSFIVTILAVIFIFKAALRLYEHVDPASRHLYLAGSTLFLAYGVLLLIRVSSWLSNPQQGLLTAGITHQVYYLVILVFEVGVGLFFVMLNNQRLEAELLKTGENLQVSVARLEKALSEVKSLSGIIPICMHCKKIRDDKGYWNRLEQFIADHSEAQFSHGICEKCLHDFYPDEDGDSRKKPKV